MSPLEKLGLELAGERWLRVKAAEGRLLAAFLIAEPDAVLTTVAIDARIRPVNGAWDDLRVHDAGGRAGDNRVRVRVCRLRDALADVGFEACILNVWGEGYRMKAPARDAIRLALEASL